MYLDWIASALGVLGCYFVGAGVRYGWLLFASASAINIFNGYTSGMLGLSAGCICYFVLEIKGWYAARRRE